jgi:hypothetical protein
MNDLDVFRRARPDIAPLDEAASDDIWRAVFGADASTRPSASRVSGRRVIAVVLAFAASVALVVALTRSDGTRSIAPATPIESLPTVTSLSTATSESTESTAAAPPNDSMATVDRGESPLSRFQPSTEWVTLFEQAREANIGRCMSAAGFDYHGSPYDTDSEAADASAGIQPDTYEAAYSGVGGQGGGCLDEAYGEIFGAVRAEVTAEQVRSWADAEWRRTAFTDPDVLAALEVLATCARGHGVEVRDVGTAPSKALDDIYRGMTEQTRGDPRLAEVQATTSDQRYVHSFEEQRAVVDVVQDEWCPTYTAFDELLEARIGLAAVAWIDANPDTMAGVDAEFAEDIARFRYIIDHDGELPPT